MLGQKIFKKHIDIYMHNYNLTESMTREKIQSWWDNVKHLEDDTFPKAMMYLMEKHNRPFGFMNVCRLAKEWTKDNKLWIRINEMKKNMPANTSTQKKVTKFREFIEVIHEQFKEGKMTGLKCIENAREMCFKLKIEKQIPVDHPGENGNRHEYEAHDLFREWVLNSWERRLN